MVHGHCPLLLGQHEETTGVEANGFFDGGNDAYAARGDFLALSHQRPCGAAENIRALFAGAQAGVIGFGGYFHLSLLASAILHTDDIADPRRMQQFSRCG